MINVGIIGCGFVGGALKDWLEHNNPECKLFISDPPKGYNDEFLKSLYEANITVKAKDIPNGPLMRDQENGDNDEF